MIIFRNGIIIMYVYNIYFPNKYVNNILSFKDDLQNGRYHKAFNYIRDETG